MPETSAQRTLVKSAPELWSELSDAEQLSGHLESFGSIRITRAEPETTVAWEGDTARGTVRLDGSGWGTRVTLTAEQQTAAPEPPAPTRSGLWGRLLRRPVAVAAPSEPAPGVDAEAVLEAVLDDLGSAHRRRPFSNA